MTMRLRFDGGTILLEGGETADATPAWLSAFDRKMWEWDRRVSAWRTDAIHYARVIEIFAGDGIAVDDLLPAWEKVGWGDGALLYLRKDQTQAVAAWMAAKRGVVVMPTGTGKTEVALAIMRETAVATLVVSPVRDLMYQWHRRILKGLGYDAGIIGDNIFAVKPVSVTTYDSACIHMDKLGNRFGLIVFDECHHLPGDIRRDAARMCAAPLRLGLTATPERSDGRNVDLDNLIGPVIHHVSISEAKGSTLADYDVVRIPVHLTEEEEQTYNRCSDTIRRYYVKRRASDPHFVWEDLCRDSGRDPEARHAQRAYFARKSIEERAEEKLRLLEDLFRLHAGSRAIIFAGSNAMARDISRRFLIPCLLNHCRRRERREILDGLREGVYPAIVANRVLDEGVDLPEAKIAIVVGGFASTRQAKQRLGRVLRKKGNERAILYEIVCGDTTEEERSRKRRKSDAYEGTCHRRIPGRTNLS